MGFIDLRHAEGRLKDDCEFTIRHAKINLERKLKSLDNSALAACLLAGEGFEVEFDFWSGTCSLYLDDPKDLAKVRAALGCKLTATGGKEPVEKARGKVWVSVKAEEFPALTIKYKAKLPKNGKCRIVTTRHTSKSRGVVCES